MDYSEFLEQKAQFGGHAGFSPTFLPDYLYDFQKFLVEWSLQKGRAAIFADCGLGKTPMQLVWAQNVVEHTQKNVLIVTPLAVSYQTEREAEKFGIKCARSDNGQPKSKITITNYERLHLFDTKDYVGTVCDESSILKNFDGSRRQIITDFIKKHPFRLLCTATAAPNDYIELGTTAEALGEMGHMDMLNRFFKNEQNNSATNRSYGKAAKWRFKKHAQTPFWRWVSSWARAMRKPSDFGFDDNGFILPPLIENQEFIDNTKPLPGELFVRPAFGLREQREELRQTLNERCEKAAELVQNDKTAVVWCHFNSEGDLLTRLIPEAKQISGSDSDDHKEATLRDFSNGEIRVLVTKPRIAGFGLNWQHCNHMTFFPSHSFEQYYQSVRRCWRFGQQNPVTVDVIVTGGGMSVLENLQRKSEQADKMFTELVSYMNDAIKIKHVPFNNQTEVPTWLS